MNVSPTYLSHINGFRNVDPNAISSKYSMYMLANTGDNGLGIGFRRSRLLKKAGGHIGRKVVEMTKKDEDPK